jgi:hypothetical protein
MVLRGDGGGADGDDGGERGGGGDVLHGTGLLSPRVREASLRRAGAVAIGLIHSPWWRLAVNNSLAAFPFHHDVMTD